MSAKLHPALMIAALTVAAAGPVAAQQTDHVFGECVLDATTVEAIQNDLADAIDASRDYVSLPSDIEVAFVMVYALNHQNDGQPLFAKRTDTVPLGFTGPVLCRNPGVSATATTEDTTIGGGVTVLDSENALIVRYETAPDAEQKRICHTVDANVDCINISGEPTNPSDGGTQPGGGPKK